MLARVGARDERGTDPRRRGRRGRGLDEDSLRRRWSGRDPDRRRQRRRPCCAVYGTTVDELVPARRQVVARPRRTASSSSPRRPPCSHERADRRRGPRRLPLAGLRPAPRHARQPGWCSAASTSPCWPTPSTWPSPTSKARLEGLMRHPTAEVGPRSRGVFRSSSLLPVAGVVVVATALGTVLVLRDDVGPTPTPAPTGVSAGRRRARRRADRARRAGAQPRRLVRPRRWSSLPSSPGRPGRAGGARRADWCGCTSGWSAAR